LSYNFELQLGTPFVPLGRLLEGMSERKDRGLREVVAADL
jgi:hypothetical protein